jgi:hypothetical protein
MRGPENKVLRSIFGYKRQEVTGENYIMRSLLCVGLLFTKYCQVD